MILDERKVKGRILSFYKRVNPVGFLTAGGIYALLFRYYNPAILTEEEFKKVILDLINRGYLTSDSGYLDAKTRLYATEQTFLLLEKQKFDEYIELPEEF